MRLEITVDGGQPYYFNVEKDVMVLGSSGTADIKIPHMHVSRKHLIIYVIGDIFYVEDQGSTNGSYLNDEKLEPLLKREFNSFFPVRLGSAVYVALASDVDTSEDDLARPNDQSLAKLSESHDTSVTRVMSISSPPTPELEKIKPPRGARRLRAKRNETQETTSFAMPIMAVLIALSGVGFFFYRQHSTEVALEKERSQTQAALMIEKKLVDKAKPVEAIKDEPLIKPEEFEKLLGEEKCLTELEMELCNAIDGARGEGWGVSKIDGRIVVFIDGSTYYEEAKKYVPEPASVKSRTASAALFNIHESNLWKLSALLFINRSLDKLAGIMLGDSVLVVGFFQRKGNGHQLGAQFLVQAPKLEFLMTDEQKIIEDAKVKGPSSLYFLDDYIKFQTSMIN